MYDYMSIHVTRDMLDEYVHEREMEGWRLVSTLPVADPRIAHAKMGLATSQPFIDSGQLMKADVLALLFKRMRSRTDLP